MSAISGIGSKGEKNKSKYKSIDINTLYKGKSVETQKATGEFISLSLSAELLLIFQMLAMMFHYLSVNPMKVVIQTLNFLSRQYLFFKVIVISLFYESGQFWQYKSITIFDLACSVKWICDRWASWWRADTFEMFSLGWSVK